MIKIILEEKEDFFKKNNYKLMFDNNMKENVIDFKENETYYIYENGNKYKIHICSIVENEMIVYKYFGKYKQYWHYEIKSRFELTSKVFINYIRFEKKGSD